MSEDVSKLELLQRRVLELEKLMVQLEEEVRELAKAMRARLEDA